MSLRDLLPCLLLLTSLVACRQADTRPADENDFPETGISKTLSNQFVHTIAEDSLGHIWIGTFRGLNRYDSHDFHHYFASNADSTIPDDQIRHILKDSRGRLWIATVNGVCRYTGTDRFTTVRHPGVSRYIKEVVETSDGRIFFNNYDGSLMRYLPQTDSCEVVIAAMDHLDKFFTTVHPDTDGRLWLRTPRQVKCYDPGANAVVDSLDTGGRTHASFMAAPHELWITGPGTLKILDTRTRRFRKLPGAITADPVLSKYEIEYIHPYGDNGVLLMTGSDGMYLYDRDSDKVIAENADGFPFEVPDFKISTIFTDSRGNLWFGSEDQGYAVHYHYKERFNGNNYLRSALENRSVVSVAADSDNRLWIVTKRDGIYIYDPSHNGLSHIAPAAFAGPGDSAAPLPYHVYAADDSMWVMLKNSGMVSCTFEDGKFSVGRRHDVWMPMQSFSDRDRTLWVGTASPYVCYKRPDSPAFESLQVFDGFCFTPALAEFDNSHILALSFNQPLKIIDTRTLEVSKAPCDTASFAAALRRSVFIPTCVHAGRDSTFWIGTVSNGLLRYRPSDGTFSRIAGMPCSDISSIEEDADGKLWISTLHGLARLDPATLATERLFAYDGIGGNQFYDRASARMMHGTLIFGGTHGLTFFRPGEVSVTPEAPLLFENLKIHNRIIRPEPGGNIERHMMYAPPVRLDHDQNSFSISFVALDFCENQRIPCQYRLVGVDNEWVDANDRHEAGYADIPPGHYRFEVRAPSGDGFHTISLDIDIARAWWASWWAMAAYVIAGLAIIYLLLSARNRVQAERRAVEAARLEKEQEQRVNAMNMRFFANVSHEFRTPLTMISGPVPARRL